MPAVEYRTVGRHILHDHKPLGTLPFKDVIRLSSNIGTAKAPVSFKKACNRFFDVSKLGERTGDGTSQESGIDEELLKVLGDAFRQSTRDEEGYTTLSELGQRATQISSFSVRNYGFRSLKDLVRSLPHYDVKTNGDNGIRVKRMR